MSSLRPSAQQGILKASVEQPPALSPELEVGRRELFIGTAIIGSEPIVELMGKGLYRRRSHQGKLVLPLMSPFAFDRYDNFEQTQQTLESVLAELQANPDFAHNSAISIGECHASFRFRPKNRYGRLDIKLPMSVVELVRAGVGLTEQTLQKYGIHCETDVDRSWRAVHTGQFRAQHTEKLMSLKNELNTDANMLRSLAISPATIIDIPR